MRKFNLIAWGIVLSVLLFACNQTTKTTEKSAEEAELTIENLKAAINGESNTSLRYEVSSEEARLNGMFNIAKMFKATAAAEMVHVKNHQAVLKDLGIENFVATIEEYEGKGDVPERLEESIAGETYEFTEMYPVFIETAKAENQSAAVKSFEQAMKAEKRHAEHYQAALELLKAEGNDKNVSSEWYVCPICGELTPTIEGMSNCFICGEKVEKFKKF